MKYGELFYVKKARESGADFQIYICGDFDFLPSWWSRALDCVWSWWDGDVGDDAGNQMGYRLADGLSAEQRASVKRLLRRAVRETKKMPTFGAADLARCDRAFSA